MDVLKISETKVKIMLTKSDVKQFGLDASDLDYADPRTRLRVWEILDCVKKNYGFDHEGEKLLIQFYPSKDGGAELFVTKLSGLSQKNERSLSKTTSVTMLDSKRMMYNFKDFSDLVRATKIINNKKSIKESNLFYDDSEGYYLEIVERGATRLGCICEFAILLEFAKAAPTERFPYITEHCTKLSEGDAVGQLARL